MSPPSRWVAALALALAMVLTGCAVSAPTADSAAGTDGGGETTDPTANNTTTGPIEDSGLPVDENRVYNRTRDLLGSDADAPSIEVRGLDRRIGTSSDPFFDLVGLTNAGANETEGLGTKAFVNSGNTVVVNEEYVEFVDEWYVGNETVFEHDAELLLAHEFTHVVQFDEGWWSAPGSSTEERLRNDALIEGGAVFTADRYAEANGISVSRIQQREQGYQNASAGALYGLAPYHHGGQYFDAVLDDASELDGVYEGDLPPTTEAILFPGANGTEQADVNVTTTVDREGWEYNSWVDETYGAMFVHVVVTAQTDVETADEVARGWATDRLLTFESDAGPSYAWVTHWDSAADASEFEAAMETTLANRTDDAAERVSLTDAGDRTVVVLAGNETFREAVSVSGTGSSVEVVLPSEDGAAQQGVVAPRRATAG